MDDCRFLVFRPDRIDTELPHLGETEPTYSFEPAVYGLDGEKIIIYADYPGSTYGELVSVSIIGAPQKNHLDRWYVVETVYTVDGDENLRVERHDRNSDLDIHLLPEHYEPIRQEYEACRAMGISIISPEQALDPKTWDAYQAALERWVDILGTGLGLSDELRHEVQSRALEEVDDPEGKLEAYIGEMDRVEDYFSFDDRPASRLQKALGLTVLNDEERAMPIGVIPCFLL